MGIPKVIAKDLRALGRIASSVLPARITAVARRAGLTFGRASKRALRAECFQVRSTLPLAEPSEGDPPTTILERLMEQTSHNRPSHIIEQTDELLKIVAAFGLEERPQPIQLASGAMSKYFVDAKQALADGNHLRVACEAVIALAKLRVPNWNAVGGLTMGADPLAHGIALLTGRSWFTVRKDPKNRGSNKLIEAVAMSADTQVLLIDDVVTMGGSIRKAYEAVVKDGAQVVFATALVDRGVTARLFFENVNVPYEPLLTYEDLRIPAILPEPLPDAASL